jgi:hypothetical protein
MGLFGFCMPSDLHTIDKQLLECWLHSPPLVGRSSGVFTPVSSLQAAVALGLTAGQPSTQQQDWLVLQKLVELSWWPHKSFATKVQPLKNNPFLPQRCLEWFQVHVIRNLLGFELETLPNPQQNSHDEFKLVNPVAGALEHNPKALFLMFDPSVDGGYLANILQSMNCSTHTHNPKEIHPAKRLVLVFSAYF